MGYADDREPGQAPLDVLKALGDNTRYAIYLELARSPSPLATATISQSLGLHPNTVRPHLERMRDVGLLEVRSAPPGGVGRPQNLYSLAADAPSLGLEPPVFPMLASMLLQMGIDAGLSAAEAVVAGAAQGRELASAHRGRTPCVDSAMAMLARLGFDPERVDEDDGSSTIGFANCPFGVLAERNPELVCALHRGLVDGFVDAVGGVAVVDFHGLADREPCLVQLAVVD